MTAIIPIIILKIIIYRIFEFLLKVYYREKINSILSKKKLKVIFLKNISNIKKHKFSFFIFLNNL